MSAMSEYMAVTFGSMQAAEADFASVHAAFQNTLSTLESQVNTSLSSWTGAAQNAYFSAKTKWNAASADMAAVVQQLSAVIGTANANYQGAERANTSMWG
jgi:early secretory antigenic target protein ESAT-6